MSDNELTGKVGLDVSEFKSGIAQMNRDIRVIESGFKATSAALGDWGKSIDGVQMRIKALTSELEVQQRKVDATRKAYQQLVAEKGAESRAAQDMLIKLNKETESLNKMQRELTDSSAALNKLQTEEKQTAKETDNLSKQENRATTSTIRFGGAMRGLGTALSGAARGIAGFAAGVARTVARMAAIVATIGLAAGAAVAGFLVSTIGPASDLNETVSKVGVVFGDAADQVIAFGKKAATALGMSQNDALTAAGTYGNLFRAMGLGNDVSAEMSTNLVQLAGDLASFNNMDPTEVMDKLRAGLTGESEPLKSLGININETVIKAKAMEMGFKLVNGQLSAGAKAQAAYALMLEQSALAQGDFARTSGGMANQQRILKAQFANLKATIGTGLLPLVTGLAQALNNMLASPGVQAGAKAISDALADIGKAIQAAIAGDSAGAMAGIFNAIKGLGSLGGLNLTQITGVFGTLKTTLAPIGATIQRVAGYFTDFFAILTGGGSASATGKGIGGLIARILGDTTKSRAQFLTAGLGLIQGLLEGIVAALPTLLPMAVQLVTQLVTSIVAALPLLLQTGVQIVMALINSILPMLPMLLQAGIDALLALANGITQALPQLIPTMVLVITQLVTTLVTNLPLLVNAALQLILALVQGIIAALPVLIAAAPQIIQALVDALIVALPMILTAAVQILGALIQGILTNLPMLLGAAAQIVAQLASGIVRLVPQLWAAGKQVIQGLWDGIRSGWAAMLAGFEELVAMLPGAIKSILGIASPSKVFAGIGENMAAGLSVGFTRQMRLVERQINGALSGLAGGGLTLGLAGAGAQVSNTSSTANYYAPVYNVAPGSGSEQPVKARRW